MASSEKIAQSVQQLSPEFLALSDSIWDEPELRWEEHKSMAKQIAVAEAHGGRIIRNAGGVPTAFAAEWGSGSPVIAFLGEYDALASLSQRSGSNTREPEPGNASGHGHGCGHNLLGSGSLLAATATAKYLAENNLPGTVRYYGCPAEEGAAGKSFMVAGGAFEDVDATVTWHPAEAMSTTQILTNAYTQAYFRFRGTAAHAGASPHLGRSALDAAELMNVGVNFLREHMGDAERIHYAFIDAGGPSANVVQPTATLYYVIRSPRVATMRELYERVKRIAQGAAMMTDTEVEIEFDGASAEILPNRVMEELLHENVQAIGGVPFDEEDHAFGRSIQESVTPAEVSAAKRRVGLSADDSRGFWDGVGQLIDPAHRPLMSGSTDVGDVSWVTPTVQIMGGTAALGTPFHSWQMVAQGKSRSAHKGMVHAATAMAGTALDLLTRPEVLQRAREEFDGIIAETPYDCPIPEGTVPPPLREGYNPA